MMYKEGYPCKYFRLEELLSPDGMSLYTHNNVMPLRPELLTTLDEFREYVDKPLLVNHGELRLRGYRSCRENVGVGGATHSMHLQGIAVDIGCKHITTRELHRKALEFYKWTGIGYNEKQGFIHCDVRITRDGKRMFWDYGQ
jgi:uncharacterized protein YcbK (DUF882 family)